MAAARTRVGENGAPLEDDLDDFELSDNGTLDLNHSHALSRAGIEEDDFDRKENFVNPLYEPTRKHYNNMEYLNLQRRSSNRF